MKWVEEWGVESGIGIDRIRKVAPEIVNNKKENNWRYNLKEYHNEKNEEFAL